MYNNLIDEYKKQIINQADAKADWQAFMDKRGITNPSSPNLAGEELQAYKDIFYLYYVEAEKRRAIEKEINKQIRIWNSDETHAQIENIEDFIKKFDKK